MSPPLAGGFFTTEPPGKPLVLLGCILKPLRGQTSPLGEVPPSQAFPSCPWPFGLVSRAGPDPMTHIHRGLSRRKWAHCSFLNRSVYSSRGFTLLWGSHTHTPPLMPTPKQKLGSRKDPVSMPSIQGSKDIQSFSVLSFCFFFPLHPSLPTSFSLPPSLSFSPFSSQNIFHWSWGLPIQNPKGMALGAWHEVFFLPTGFSW